MKNLKATGKKWNLMDGAELVDVVEEYTCTFENSDAENYPGLVAGADGWH